MIMNKKVNLNGGHFILLIVILIVLYLCLKDVFVKNETKEKGKEIVVKFTSKVVLPKTTNFYFTYFINGKKISSANSGINYDISNSKEETQVIKSLKINAFYLAKSISKYPKIIIVNPSKQITDTTIILKAGFSREEIGEVKED